MKVLVLNCGSSSIKYKLYDMANEAVLAQGGVERIGLDEAFIKVKLNNGEKKQIMRDLPTHKEGVALVFECLLDPEIGAIKSLDEIDAVGHRVVQGGDLFEKSCIVTPEVEKGIESLIDLAPVHNKGHLAGIRAVNELMPNTPQVTVFDNAFHSTMPDYAYLYAIPMGLTPLAGLMMGSRCGDIDPSAVTYLMEKLNKTPQEMANFLNKESGVLGITGISSDMRDVENADNNGDKMAHLALEMYSYRIKKYIGAYAAAMNGVDIIVFTAGVGENQIGMRVDACAGLDYLGVKIDEERNNVRGKETIISADDSKVKVVLVPTDEEIVIARDTRDLVAELKK